MNQRWLSLRKSWSTFLALLFISFFVVGCPLVTISDLGIKPGSITDDRFTISATVEVDFNRQMCVLKKGEPQNDDCEPEPEAYFGHGLLGIWLPDGIEIGDARLMDSNGDNLESLEPMQYTSSAFPDTLPHVPGKWWPFMTNCKEIDEGTRKYIFEFDVNGVKDIKKFSVLAAIEPIHFDDISNSSSELDNIGPAKEIVVDLVSGTVEQIDTSQHPVSLDPAQGKKLEQCKNQPNGIGTVTPGPRGCSCDTVGIRQPSFGSLLQVLVGLF